jgi:hypothetical protein
MVGMFKVMSKDRFSVSGEAWTGAVVRGAWRI